MPIYHILDVSNAYFTISVPMYKMCRYQHDGLFLQLIPLVRDFELDLPPTHHGGCVLNHQAHNLA